MKAAETIEPPLNEVERDGKLVLNNAPEARIGVEVIDRNALFKPLARLMEAKNTEASATDLSRLAWLYLHAGDEVRALDIAYLA